MYCKNNEQQLSDCHYNANMKFQTYSSSSLQIFLFDCTAFHNFLYVNMDVFDFCAHVSCDVLCMKRHSKNAVLKLKEVQLIFSCIFSYSTARVAPLSTQNRILCERHLAIYYFTLCVTPERLIMNADMWLDHFFLFTVIIGILSKCLILTFLFKIVIPQLIKIKSCQNITFELINKIWRKKNRPALIYSSLTNF